MNVASGLQGTVGVELDVIEYFSLELQGGMAYMPMQYFTMVHTPSGNLEGSYTTVFFPASLTVKAKAPMGRVTLYGGVGPSFGLAANTKIVVDYGGSGEHIEAKLKYGLGFGYHGVFGAAFGLGKHFTLLAEVRGEQLTFRAKRATVTAYTVNGVDQLSTLDTADREVEFVEDLAAYLNAPPNPNAPTQELAFNMPGDSVNVFVGAALTF